MARTEIRYTLPGTVAHGHVIFDGNAEFASYEIEGAYMGDMRAENYVRKNINPTFNLESVSHFKKIYTMPIKLFTQHAQLIDIQEVTR